MSLWKKLASLLLLLPIAATSAQRIQATEAGSHLGEHETVCGNVAEIRTAIGARGTPTFIDFERSYPRQVFTAVIWQRDRANIGSLPRFGRLCVTGIVTTYRGQPQLVLRSRSDWFAPQPELSNNNHYTNVDGLSVHSPAYSSGGVPPGASAQCSDGTYSFSAHRQGTCSHHGGVARWL